MRIGPKIQDEILVLRYLKLAYLPPALYPTQILAQNFRVTVFEFGASSLKFIPNYCRSVFGFVWAQSQMLVRTLVKGAPRLIVAHGIAEQTIALFMKRLFAIRYVVHVHEICEKADLSRWNQLLFRFERSALRNAEFLVFPHLERLGIYRERYSLKNPLYFVPNCPLKVAPPLVRDLRREYGLPQEAVIVLYLGGIGPGIEFQAMIEALPRFPNLHFFIFGYGAASEKAVLRNLSKSLNVEGQVHGLCGLPEKEKWPTLFGGDLFYCVYEKAGLRFQNMSTASSKFMEAMAAGLPTLCSDTEDFKAFSMNHGFAIPTGVRKSGELAKTLASLIASPHVREQMRGNGRNAHEKNWNYELWFRPVLAAYLQKFQ